MDFTQMAEMKPYTHLAEKPDEKLYLRIAVHIKTGWSVVSVGWVPGEEEDDCGVRTLFVSIKEDSSATTPQLFVHEEEILTRIAERRATYKAKVQWGELPGQGSTMIAQEDADEDP